MEILITGALKYNKVFFKHLEELGHNITFVKDERTELNMDVENIEVIICNNLFQYNEIDNFKSLKTIQLTSAGYDRVPLERIKERDINIFNAKDTYGVPIAEWVILNMLEVYKESFFFYDEQKKKNWKKIEA